MGPDSSKRWWDNFLGSARLMILGRIPVCSSPIQPSNYPYSYSPSPTATRVSTPLPSMGAAISDTTAYTSIALWQYDNLPELSSRSSSRPYFLSKPMKVLSPIYKSLSDNRSVSPCCDPTFWIKTAGNDQENDHGKREGHKRGFSAHNPLELRVKIIKHWEAILLEE